MYDLLLDKSPKLDRKSLDSYAKELGLDETASHPRSLAVQGIDH